MYIHSKKPHLLSDTTYKKLHRLNYRSHGSMQDALRYSRTRKCMDATVFWIEENGKIISWALVYKRSPEYDKRHEVHLYTRITHRRRGYANKLMKKINDRYDKMAAYPHNNVAGKFFSNFPKRKIRHLNC